MAFELIKISRLALLKPWVLLFAGIKIWKVICWLIVQGSQTLKKGLNWSPILKMC